MKDKYSEDDQLTLLANEVARSSPSLADATKFQWKIIFTNSSLGDEEVAGKCTLVSGAIRYLWGQDYLIQIQRQHFDSGSPIDKTRILIHELFHIGAGEEGQPIVRKHGKDFCSVPSHDQFPYSLSREIYRKLKHLASFETQKQIEVTAT